MSLKVILFASVPTPAVTHSVTAAEHWLFRGAYGHSKWYGRLCNRVFRSKHIESLTLWHYNIRCTGSAYKMLSRYRSCRSRADDHISWLKSWGTDKYLPSGVRHATNKLKLLPCLQRAFVKSRSKLLTYAWPTNVSRGRIAALKLYRFRISKKTHVTHVIWSSSTGCCLSRKWKGKRWYRGRTVILRQCIKGGG